LLVALGRAFGKKEEFVDQIGALSCFVDPNVHLFFVRETIKALRQRAKTTQCVDDQQSWMGGGPYDEEPGQSVGGRLGTRIPEECHFCVRLELGMCQKWCCGLQNWCDNNARDRFSRFER